ncbi:MAG: 3'-5' exonuclease [Gemmatimonadetes bacterium]|nr:3'-5' exonuclease [Gemmatimonadota bacterium]
MLKLPFELERPVAFFDLETTGLSLSRDRIVELAIIRISPQGDVYERVRRLNPEMPIPPEAAAVHGITDDVVQDEPTFRQIAKNLAAILDPCDLGGFNIRRFDLPILLAEFRRAGVEFEVKDRRIIDMKMIFHREEPRDLSAAARFYLGRDHQDAHTALGDIRTTAAVLTAQLEHYPHLPRDLDGLHAYCDEMDPFETEFDRWFSQEDRGLVFRRGKHKGSTIDDVAQSAPDYLEWMMGADDMPAEVLDVVRQALSGVGSVDGADPSDVPAPPGPGG